MESIRLQREQTSSEPDIRKTGGPRQSSMSGPGFSVFDLRPPVLRFSTHSRPSAAGAVQAKLSVSQPSDQYEQEADRVADQVMRMPDSAFRVQRKCGCGGSGGVCNCESHEPLIQRRAAINQPLHPPAPPIVHDVLRSPGQSLDLSTRRFFEQRFGQSLSRVRIHTDETAAQSARAMNALAYTVGHNVAFAEGRYQPHTSAGRQLLAHELTHVMQQRGNDDSGVVHRQNPPAPNPNPPPRFPIPGCILDGTNTQMPIATGQVTIVQYGAQWCGPCVEEHQWLNELCNQYRSRPNVHFYLVDRTDDTRDASHTYPPVPSSFPSLLVYAGTMQTFNAIDRRTNKPEVKAAIDAAIPCASNPMACGPQPLEQPSRDLTEDRGGCAIQPSAAPSSSDNGGPNRFRFNVNTVDFAAGQEAALESRITSLGATPAWRVTITGMASSDGPDAGNRIVSCQRALAATRVFARHGIVARALVGTGPVAGTDNNANFRAVEVAFTAPITPRAGAPSATSAGPCDLATCAPNFAISGPPTIRKSPKFTDPAQVPPGAPGTVAQQMLQTLNCDPALFQITQNPAASNVFITSVSWVKEPPAGTLSVQRTAQDERGDNPQPSMKAPSFATLNPVVTSTEWDNRVNNEGGRMACWTNTQQPSWCVPFCSFGQFTMVATVSWQCGTTTCANKVTTSTLVITVQRR